MLDFAKDKKLWDRVRTSDDFARHRQVIKEKYDNAFKEEMHTLNYSEIFGKKSDVYGGVYMRRLFRLQSSALMSMIYYDNEEYFDNLVDTIWDYCNEYTWAPLGHYNSYYNRKPTDYDPGLIDIYASSIAFSLAEIKHLMADRLPQIVIDRITAEIRRRTIEPYINRRFFWEHHDNNWTAVCAGAVGGVLLYEAPDVYEANRERLRASMQCYINSYADDGVCVEGSAYWGFGFGFFTVFASLLYEYSGGKENYFEIPKVKQMAMFIQKTFLDTNCMVSFGDCNPTENYWIGLPHMLKLYYGDAIDNLPEAKGTIMAYQHFAFALRSVIYFDKKYVSNEELKPVLYNMKSSGWMLKRTTKYGIAIKGGNNGESHNHNDVGSFILAKDNKEIFVDVGAGPYVDGYHGNKRYTFFHPSSWSHNVPYFGDKPQDGIRREPNVIIDYDEKTNTASYEFARAYGLDYVKSINRSFVLNEDNIILTDVFDVVDGTPITERFVTYSKPVLEGDVLILDGVKFKPDIPAKPDIKYVKAPNHVNSDTFTDVYCIDYTLPLNVKTFKAEIKID